MQSTKEYEAMMASGGLASGLEKLPTVKPLEWQAVPPVGLEGEPGDRYALGVGGHYCLKKDFCLFWVEDPFTWDQFNDKTEAKAAAQIDHKKRVLALLL